MPVIFASPDDEYKKYKKLRREDVLAIMAWAEKQAHLPKLPEILVICMLHACNYSGESTKTTLENFCTVRAHIPEVFVNRNLKQLVPKMDFFLCTPFPGLSPKGHLVLFTKLMDTDVEKYDYLLTCIIYDMVCSIYLAQYGTVSGVVVVCDFSGFSFSHIVKINLTLMRKFIFYLQEALPSMLKELHFINTSPALEKVLSLARPFMKKEITDVIHFHTKLETFFKYVPQEMMPEEYGGRIGTLAELHAKCMQNLLDNEDHLKEQEKIVTDESKRKEKSKYIDDILGGSMEGTFKKLDID